MYSLIAGSFRIFDVQDPGTPARLADLPLSNDVRHLDLQGDHAYVTDNVIGLIVIDVSNPATPTPVDTVTVTGMTGIVVDGNYAYVGVGSSVKVIDVHDPTNASIVATVATTYNVADVRVHGNILFAGRIETIDITTPTAPVLLNTYNDSFWDFVIHGDHLLAGDQGSLKVLDISIPASPSQVASGVGSAYALDIAGDFAFTGSSNGYGTWDISDLTAPALLGRSDVGAYRALAYQGDFIFGTYVQRAFDRLYDSGKNVVQSTRVNDIDAEVWVVTLNATYQGEVDWYLSPSGGAWWQKWYRGSPGVFSVPGTDLRWRAVFKRSGLAAPVSLSEVSMNWYYDVPVITSISDLCKVAQLEGDYTSKNDIHD